MVNIEKYWIIDKTKSLFIDFMKYKDNVLKVNDIVKWFSNKWEIEASKYIASNNKYSIVASKSDLDKFSSQFAKNKIDWNIYSFKETSEVGKDWIKTLQYQNLEVMEKPYFPFYLTRAVGKGSFRLFEMGGDIYASYCSENEFEAPKGFIEMKPSDFYKAIENNQSKVFN